MLFTWLVHGILSIFLQNHSITLSTFFICEVLYSLPYKLTDIILLFSFSLIIMTFLILSFWKSFFAIRMNVQILLSYFPASVKRGLQIFVLSSFSYHRLIAMFLSLIHSFILQFMVSCLFSLSLGFPPVSFKCLLSTFSSAYLKIVSANNKI